MKLSIEAKVAAAVAAAFVALTVGAIAQQNRVGYGPSNNPGVSTHINQEGYNSSLPGRTVAEENRHRLSTEDESVNTGGSGEKTRTVKSRRHYTHHVGYNRRADMNEPGD